MSKPLVAMVSRWGITCGIDDYTRDLVNMTSEAIQFVVHSNEELGAFDAGTVQVIRDWDASSDETSALFAAFDASPPDAIHVQFNWSAMTLSALGGILDYGRQRNVPVLVQLHATMDNPGLGSLSTLATRLQRAALVVVHGSHDVERLKRMGIVENVWRWRLGGEVWPVRDANELRLELGLADRSPVIATFGFLQERKGLLELIDAVAILKREYPDIMLLACSALHPRGFDTSYFLECRKRIGRDLIGSAALIPHYLPEAAVMAALQSADAVVLPYVATPEGTSAAAKFCSGAARPMIVSAEPLFEDYRSAALTLESVDAQAIAAAIDRVMRDSALRASLAASAAAMAGSLSWSIVGPEYIAKLGEVLAAHKWASGATA